jgi:hypothetical protein
MEEEVRPITLCMASRDGLLIRVGTGPSALEHFKDEIKHQYKELTWQNRKPRK